MKKILHNMLRKLLALAIFFSTATVYAQRGSIYNFGRSISIVAGSEIHMAGNYQNDSVYNGVATFNGQINSEGHIYIAGNITNNASNTLFPENASYQVTLNGSHPQFISGDSIAFSKLNIDNPTQVHVDHSTVLISDSLHLKNGNFVLNNGIIDLGINGIVANESATRQIIGNGKIRAQQRTSQGNDIAGTRLSISGSTGAIDIERIHSDSNNALNVAEGSLPWYYKVNFTNTADVAVAIDYYDYNETLWTPESNLGIYKSNDSLKWRLARSSVVDELSNQVTASLDNFKSGWLTLSRYTCDSPPDVVIQTEQAELCEGSPMDMYLTPSLDEYQWSTGDTNYVTSINTPGLYSVIRIQDDGCEDSSTIMINQNPTPVAGYTMDVNSICQNGTISFSNTSTTSSGTLTYEWRFGDGSTSAFNDPVHFYSNYGLMQPELVTISDKDCKDSTTKNLRVHPNPNVGFYNSPACEEANVLFTDSSSVDSMVDGVAYALASQLWITHEGSIIGSSSLQQVFPDTGVYSTSRIVSTNAGCRDTLTKAITVHPLPSVDFTVPDVCGNESFIPTNNTTGASSYHWRLADTTIGTGPNPTLLISTEGIIPLELIASSSVGCQDSLEQGLTVLSTPNADFTLDNDCENTTFSPINNSTISSGTLNYHWDFDNGDTANTHSPNVVFNAYRTYNVSLQAIAASGCKDTLVETLEVYPNPTASFTHTPACDGSAVTFSNTSSIPSGSLTNFWLFDDHGTSSLNSPSYVFTSNGIFPVKLIATSDLGCSDSISELATVHWRPSVYFGDTITTCNDSLIIDVTSSNSTYLWTNGSTLAMDTTVVNQTIGVQITSNHGCIGGDTAYVALNTLSEIKWPDNTTVCDSTTLDIFMYNHDYLWSTGETTSSIKVLSSDSIWVVRSEPGCSVSDTMFVNVSQSPVFDLPEHIASCTGDTVVLSTGFAGFDHNWSNGGTSSSIDVLSEGTYLAVVTNPEGCSFSDSSVLFFHNYPSFTLGNDTSVCDVYELDLGTFADELLWHDGSSNTNFIATGSETIWLKATNGGVCSYLDSVEVTVVKTPVSLLPPVAVACLGNTYSLFPGPADNYLWSNGATSASIEVMTDDTVSITMDNASMCFATDTVIVTYVVPPSPDLGSDTIICPNDIMQWSEYAFGFTTEWYNSNGLISSDTLLQTSIADTYHVLMYNAGVCQVSDTVHLGLLPEINADFVATSVAEISDTIQLVQVSSPQPTAYHWSFGDGTTSALEHPQHQFFVADSFQVELIAYFGSCSDTVTKSIVIFNTGELDIDIHLDSIPIVKFLEVLFYPNPFENTLNSDIELSLPDEVHLYMFDESGNSILQESYYGDIINKTFDASYLTPGAYTIILITGNDKRVIKLIKI